MTTNLNPSSKNDPQKAVIKDSNSDDSSNGDSDSDSDEDKEKTQYKLIILLWASRAIPIFAAFAAFCYLIY